MIETHRIWSPFFGRRALIDDHDSVGLLLLLPYVDAALTGVAPATEDNR